MGSRVLNIAIRLRSPLNFKITFFSCQSSPFPIVALFSRNNNNFISILNLLGNKFVTTEGFKNETGVLQTVSKEKGISPNWIKKFIIRNRFNVTE